VSRQDRLEQSLLGTAFAMVEVLRSLVEYMALGVPREHMPEAERTMLDEILIGRSDDD
jgi:hypothetical protein